MKISELIAKLLRIKNEHGDVLVGMNQEWTEEVDDATFIPKSPTGFSNPQDGDEYTDDHVSLGGGKRNRIFFRKK